MVVRSTISIWHLCWQHILFGTKSHLKRTHLLIEANIMKNCKEKCFFISNSCFEDSSWKIIARSESHKYEKSFPLTKYWQVQTIREVIHSSTVNIANIDRSKLTEKLRKVIYIHSSKCQANKYQLQVRHDICQKIYTAVF